MTLDDLESLFRRFGGLEREFILRKIWVFFFHLYILCTKLSTWLVLHDFAWFRSYNTPFVIFIVQNSYLSTLAYTGRLNRYFNHVFRSPRKLLPELWNCNYPLWYLRSLSRSTILSCVQETSANSLFRPSTRPHLSGNYLVVINLPFCFFHSVISISIGSYFIH